MLKGRTAEDINELARSYQAACVLAAAAELDLFSIMAGRQVTARAVAEHLECDLRAVTVLLDALAALGLILKKDNLYTLHEDMAAFLTHAGSQSILATIQHQANCLRRWSQLASVVKSGKPAVRLPSVRGEAGDTASFIGAMHERSRTITGPIVSKLTPPEIKHFLDVGGGSGSWTLAFLRSHPNARATLFDLPQVIPLARKRITAAGLSRQVTLVSGDFQKDPLPGGADFVWLSAIIHQNSREDNRKLFAKAFASTTPGGRIGIRDVVMDSTRTSPLAGALFAVNMLVGTEGGGTFTRDEIREDLESAGFTKVTLLSQDPGMDALVVAEKRNPGERRSG